MSQIKKLSKDAIAAVNRLTEAAQDAAQDASEAAQEVPAVSEPVVKQEKREEAGNLHLEAEGSRIIAMFVSAMLPSPHGSDRAAWKQAELAAYAYKKKLTAPRLAAYRFAVNRAKKVRRLELNGSAPGIYDSSFRDERGNIGRYTPLYSAAEIDAHMEKHRKYFEET